MQSPMPQQLTQLKRPLQNALRVLYPPRCLLCEALVEVDYALCGACWRDTPFITGLVCDGCGLPLPGDGEAGQSVLCDGCLANPRPWRWGRSAFLYQGNGRRIVLSLKHGDRHDLAWPAALWMQQAADRLLDANWLVAPVPVHWRRLLRRRYNQAALLSAALARAGTLDHCPDLLVRRRATAVQDGLDRPARYANLSGTLEIAPRRRAMVAARSVLLVDDVLTSGATLTAATEACQAAGAREVAVLTLARVALPP